MVNNYPGKTLFPYATGYYAIFPAGFKRDAGKGSIYETKDYIIYFKPNTPEDIKQRLINDYAKYFETNEFDN